MQAGCFGQPEPEAKMKLVLFLKQAVLPHLRRTAVEFTHFCFIFATNTEGQKSTFVHAPA
jgi:hypothetical protein